MEKVISNVDVLYEIFQYLNVEELLKLTKVCPQFCTVIVDFIWKNKYRNLEICKTSQHFGLLLTNNVSDHFEVDEIGFDCLTEDKAILNRRDVDNFIKLINKNIRLLVIYSPVTNYKYAGPEKETMALVYRPIEFGIIFDDQHCFENLATIKFRHVVITANDLRLLNRSCKNLECLCLDNCFNVNERTLVIDEDIQISCLQNMKKLRCFEIIIFDTVEKDLSYDVFKILTKLNMLQLIIKVRNFSIIDDEMNENNVAMGKSLSYNKNRCEELVIGYFRSQRIFRKFNNTILSHFTNLKKLVMESWALVSLNEDFFRKLAKICSQLEYLKLKNFEFNGFAALASLNTLILSNCSGLIWREVMIMLRDMKLKRFSILDTEYIGIFEYFNVASTLKHLLVINCQRNHFKKLLDLNNGQNMINLITLVWHDNYAQVPIYVATGGTKLQTLITEPSSLLINNLYSLINLEKLTLRVERKLKFSRIITILKHLNLKHFTISKLKGPEGYDEHNYYLIDNDVYDQELREFEDKRINLTFINISLNSYFKIVQDFWFNLLKNNPKLTIMIRYNRLLQHDHRFLNYIINHRKFPKRLKSIKICGYRIEIKEFKDNFEAAIQKINAFSKIYKDKEDKGYILL